MAAGKKTQAEVLDHRLDPDGCYRMVVLTDVARRLEDGSPDPDFLRSFEWGPLPVVPDAMTAITAQSAYAAVHSRPLVAGQPFVSEREYVYLQLCEAVETVRLEREGAEAKPKVLRRTRGVTF